MYREIIASGVSFSVVNKLITAYSGEKFDCQKLENKIMHNSGLSKVSCISTSCNECGVMQRGTSVFCYNCLNKVKEEIEKKIDVMKEEMKEEMGEEMEEEIDRVVKEKMEKEMEKEMKEKISRRLQGCKQPTCYANNKNWEEMKKTLCYKSIYDLEKQHCCHERVTAVNMVYSETPEGHITKLINFGMDGCIINSTRTEVRDHIDGCKANNSLSPIACHNSVYGYGELGEIAIAQSLSEMFQNVPSTDSIRNSLENVINKMTSDGSIEQFYLSGKGLFFIL